MKSKCDNLFSEDMNVTDRCSSTGAQEWHAKEAEKELNARVHV